MVFDSRGGLSWFIADPEGYSNSLVEIEESLCRGHRPTSHDVSSGSGQALSMQGQVGDLNNGCNPRLIMVVWKTGCYEHDLGLLAFWKVA